MVSTSVMQVTWDARLHPDSALVPVAPHVRIYSPFTVTAEVEGLEADVEVEVAAVPAQGERAGRLVCREVRVIQREGGPAITGQELRAVPVAWLTKVAAPQMAATDAPDVAPGVASTMALSGIVTAKLAALAQQGPTAETLATVAYLYRLAVVVGNGPRVSIEEAFGISRSTAGRWISLARQRAHLGPVEGPGLAGG